MKKNQQLEAEILADKIIEGYEKLQTSARDFFEEYKETMDSFYKKNETQEIEVRKNLKESSIVFQKQVEEFCQSFVSNKKLSKEEKKELESLFIEYYASKSLDNKIIPPLQRFCIISKSSKIVFQFCIENGIDTNICYVAGRLKADVIEKSLMFFEMKQDINDILSQIGKEQTK